MVFSEKDVLLAQKGDQEAFTRIIRCSESSLYRVSMGILIDDSDWSTPFKKQSLKAINLS